MQVFRSSGNVARRKSIYALAGAVAVMVAAGQVSATNFTWTNGGANGLWDLVSNNWNAGAGNTVWLNNDAAPNAVTFDSGVAAAGTVTVSGTTTSAPMEVSGLTFVQGGWTLAGGFLQGSTSTTSGTLAISDTGNNTISSVIQNTSPTILTAVTLSGTGTTIFSGASTYTGGTTINGTITTVSGVSSSTTVLQTGNAGAADLSSTVNTLTVNGGALRAGTSVALFNPMFIGNNGMILDLNSTTITVDGAIADAPSSSNGGLTIVTGGTLNMERDSIFSGGLNLQAGTMFLDHAQHYTGTTTLFGTSQIRLSGTDFLPTTTVLSVQSTSGLQLKGFNQTVAGIDSGGVVNNSRAIAQTNGSGSGGIVSSTLTVTGTSTFGGRLNDGGDLLPTLVGSSGNGVGGGSTALHKTGAGTVLTLNNNSRFTGGTVIDSGTIQFAGAAGGALGGFGTYTDGQAVKPVTVNGNTAIVDLNGTVVNNAIHLNGGTLTNTGAGNGTISNGVYGVTFTGSGNFQLASSGTRTVVLFNGVTSDVTVQTAFPTLFSAAAADANPTFGLDANSFTLTSAGSGFTSAPTFRITGSTQVDANGTATLDGSGGIAALPFTYSGSGYSGAGATGITFTGGGGTAPTWTFNNDFALRGLNMTGNGSYTSAPTVTFFNTNDNSVPTGTATAVMSGITLDSDSFIGGSNGNIVLNYRIEGVGGLTKIGTDVLVLNNGVSIYAGNTTISGGTIQLGIANALPATTTLTVNGGATAGGKLDLAGQNQTIAGLSGGSGTVQGVVTNSAGGTSMLTVTGTSQFDGLIQNGTGMIELIKSTGGVLTLTNNNTYSGGTDVSGGTLIVSNATGSATGSAAVTMDGGTLGGGGAITGGVLAGSGAHTIFPSATLSTTSTSTLTVGGLTTGAGTTLQFNLVTPGNSLNHTISSSDRIAVTGSTLSLNGGAVNLTNHTTGAASLGFYKVIAFSGTISGTGLSSLSLPAVANNVSYVFDTTHDSGFIDIHRGFLGDVDDSGFVDINDLSILASNWQQVGGWAQGNFLGDPTVDINDLSVLAANWQTGIASFGDAADSLSGTSESFQQAVSSIVFGGAGSVPEPTSLALLGMGAAGLLIRRRRR